MYGGIHGVAVDRRDQTDGRWRTLDEVIGASFEEFMDVYKKTAMELSWEEIAALNDVSTEQWVQDQTDD